MLVDRMSRTMRERKESLSQEVESIFDRSQMDAQRWIADAICSAILGKAMPVQFLL
jgi:hypothetical protein